MWTSPLQENGEEGRDSRALRRELEGQTQRPVRGLCRDSDGQGNPAREAGPSGTSGFSGCEQQRA